MILALLESAKLQLQKFSLEKDLSFWGKIVVIFKEWLKKTFFESKYMFDFLSFSYFGGKFCLQSRAGFMTLATF